MAHLNHSLPNAAMMTQKQQQIKELAALYLQFKKKLDELEAEEHELAKEARKAIDEVKMQEVLAKIKNS